MKKLVFGLTLLIACTVHAQQTNSTAGTMVRTVEKAFELICREVQFDFIWHFAF